MLDRMRTTLDLDADILLAAKELAHTHGLTAGRVISDLARQGLAAQLSGRPAPRLRNGVPLLRRQAEGGSRLTMGRVNELRDDA